MGTAPAALTVSDPAACAVTRGCAAPHAANCSSVALWAMRRLPLAVAVMPETASDCTPLLHPAAVSVAAFDTDLSALSSTSLYTLFSALGVTALSVSVRS